MLWVKLRTALHKNGKFRQLSPGVRAVFYVLLEVAGDNDWSDGVLSYKDVGPLTPAAIADEAAITESQARTAIKALMASSFLSQMLDGSYVIEKFQEMTAPVDKTSADRQQRYRALRNGKSNGQDNGQNNGQNNGQKTEVDITETNVSANVPPKKAREPWVVPDFPDYLSADIPSDIDGLKTLAYPFLEAFAGITSTEAQGKYAGTYTTVLATFRSRGVDTATAWRAFCDARLANGEKPLFGAHAKTALAYLGPREPAQRRPARGDVIPFDRDRSNVGVPGSIAEAAIRRQTVV